MHPVKRCTLHMEYVSGRILTVTAVVVFPNSKYILIAVLGDSSVLTMLSSYYAGYT